MVAPYSHGECGLSNVCMCACVTACPLTCVRACVRAWRHNVNYFEHVNPCSQLSIKLDQHTTETIQALQILSQFRRIGHVNIHTQRKDINTSRKTIHTDSKNASTTQLDIQSYTSGTTIDFAKTNDL